MNKFNMWAELYLILFNKTVYFCPAEGSAVYLFMQIEGDLKKQVSRLDP